MDPALGRGDDGAERRRLRRQHELGAPCRELVVGAVHREHRTETEQHSGSGAPRVERTHLVERGAALHGAHRGHERWERDARRLHLVALPLEPPLRPPEPRERTRDRPLVRQTFQSDAGRDRADDHTACRRDERWRTTLVVFGASYPVQRANTDEW